MQQVRLQSKTQDNVVNYTAVVGVKNATGKLLPGMTATVQFLTGDARECAGRAERGAAHQTDADDARAGADPPWMTATRSSAILWTLTKGSLKPVRVHTGLSDETQTQVADTTSPQARRS